MSIKSFQLVIAALVLALGAATPASAIILDGITESGTPIITFDRTRVSVRSDRRNGGWDFSASTRNSRFSLQGFSQPLGGRGSFDLNANFDSSGNLLDGTVSIYGGVGGWRQGGSSRRNLLFSADLTAFAGAGNVLGFNTANIFCSPTLLIEGFQCTPAESVYLTLNGKQQWNGFNGLKNFNAAADSVTTLPAPATLPLIATAFSGLALRFVRRRPKTS